jgi:hypothetical protein
MRLLPFSPPPIALSLSQGLLFFFLSKRREGFDRLSLDGFFGREREL